MHHLFEEGDDHARPHTLRLVSEERDEARDQHLERELTPSLQPQRTLTDDLEEIVEQTDEPEADRRGEQHDGGRVFGGGKKERRDDRAQHDKETAHGGCARFRLVRLGAALPDRLPRLEPAQETYG